MRASPGPTGRWSECGARWRDGLLASDPGLVRLRTAARAVLTAGLAAAVLLPLARWLQQPPPVALIGVAVPLMSTVAVQDPAPPQQLRTLLLLPLIAIPSVVVGTWVSGKPWWSGACFVALIVAGLQARRLGPRGTGLGMVAYLAYFYALLLQLRPGNDAWVAASLLVGTLVALAVRRSLPEPADRLLRGELRSYRAGSAVLLEDLARTLDRPGSRRATKRVGRGLARLNDLALAIDTRLAQFAPAGTGAPAESRPPARDGLRDRVLHGEIAMETVASATSQAARRPALEPASRRRMSELLLALSGTVRRGTPFVAGTSGEPELPLDSTMRWRFWRATRTLAGDPAWDLPLPPLRDTPAPAQPGHKPADGPHAFTLDWTTRQSLQAGVAATGAIVAGRAISPDHWFWAVFAAFVVFTRAASVGQALSQAWKRAGASVAGVVLGLGVAAAVQGTTTMELVLLFVFIAAGFHAFRDHQPVYTMLLTSMLAMLYELLGSDTSGLLWIRLWETIAGAAIAVLAGVLVVPIRTREHSDRESAALLREAARVLREALEQPRRRPARDAVRELDRRLQSLRRTLGPVTSSSYPAPTTSFQRREDQLAALVHCIRHLYSLTDRDGRGLQDEVAVPQLARAVTRTMESVAAGLDGEPRDPLVDLPADPPGPAASERIRVAVDWLRQADRIARAIDAEHRTHGRVGPEASLRRPNEAADAAGPPGRPRMHWFK